MEAAHRAPPRPAQARTGPHRPAQLAYGHSLFAPADATASKVCHDFVRAVLLTLDREPRPCRPPSAPRSW